MHKKPSFSLVSLLLVVLLAVVPVGLSSAYFVSSTTGERETAARSSVNFYLDQVSQRSEAILRSLRGMIYILTTDPSVRQAMLAPGVGQSLLKQEAESHAGRLFLGNDWGQGSVTGIFLMQDEQNYLSVLREGIYSGSHRRAAAVLHQYKNHNSARNLVSSPENPDYSYLVANYIDIRNQKIVGKIIVEIDTRSFVNDHYIHTLYQQAEVYLSGQQNTLLYGNSDSPLAESITRQKSADDFMQVAGLTYYHKSKKIPDYDVWLDVFIPEQEIVSTIWQTVQLYVLFTAVVLLFTLATGLGLYTLLTKPLRNIVKALDVVAAGNLAVQVPATPYRETERVAAAFNAMTENLENLFMEVYTKGLHLRQAEYLMLESQINPHFFFNVLEVINMRALAAEQQDICRMVNNLAQLLRSNISHRHRQKITLGQELEYVRYYLELQKERFLDHLEYSIQIEDEEMLGYFLPKLSIQPLVENAIVHGLEPKRDGGTVAIGVWEEENGVYIRVSDNGVGFDVAQLDLNAMESAHASNHNHVALYNINRRIQLLYGPEFGIQATSQPGKGSKMTLMLPVDTQQDEEGSWQWN